MANGGKGNAGTVPLWAAPPAVLALSGRDRGGASAEVRGFTAGGPTPGCATPRYLFTRVDGPAFGAAVAQLSDLVWPNCG